jgi:pimeloyl-ACP methyl ester carboxylesterase
LTMLARSELLHEESLWFGGTDRPLFGRLTTPLSGTSRGGVLLSPPIGRESRLARRAMRSLAILLAIDGFATLRFDHFGTGDSGGSLDDQELDAAWMEGVDQGVILLRSLGVPSVSAVGMRLGATIIGTAAAKYDLGLSSFVMWDPCETGRTYVRELAALGALHRDIVSAVLDESTEMLEYALSDGAASRVSQFTLIEPASNDVAERILVVARDDRPVSRKFRSRWESEHVEWVTTSEQGPLLEAELPASVQPDSAIAEIQTWLTSAASSATPLSSQSHSREVVVIEGSNSLPVRETVVELGFRKMFAIVSEPVGDVRGPLMVMVNGVNEDHVGPARLWVELSRRWSSWGLRCVRFDLSELGESPWALTEPERPVWDRSRPQDIGDAVRALSLTTPADSVLVGYCSGAPLAIVVAQRLKSRGVCAINPQVGAGVFRNVGRVKRSDRESVQTFVRRMENVLVRHRWVDQAIHQVTRLVLSSAYPPRMSQALIDNNSEMLLVLSPEDLSPLRRNPIVGWILRRRLVPSEHVHIEIVPGLDHAILSTIGRGRAVDILDRHVIETFLGGVTDTQSGRIAVDGL